MRYFDLHCDTLYRAVTENSHIARNNFAISLEKKDLFDRWIQCFALWIPDNMEYEDIERMFCAAKALLYKETTESDFEIYNDRQQLNSKYTAVFTVEGGRIIGGDLSKIKMLAENNVKVLTLTWNGDNEIACGTCTADDRGLTQFGRNVIRELEKNKVIVDVSHLSDRSFYDVSACSSVPFIATHSNSRKICSNKRNLTDDQFEIIRDRSGIVGLNFYKGFLNDVPDKSGIKDIISHCEHFLALGGENTLAIGSDFDGADMPGDIRGIADITKIYESFLRLNYSETLLNKLFWLNAFEFFRGFDN